MINTCNSEIQCIVLLHDHEMSTLIYLKVKKHFEGLKNHINDFLRKNQNLPKSEKPKPWTLALEFLRVNELHFVYYPFSMK